MPKTYVQKPAQLTRNWHLIDVNGQVLGRTAAQIARLLIGKHKPTYTPHLDGGDYVVAVNAALVSVTGNKDLKKVYYRHSGYPGGLKQETLGQLRQRLPEKIIERAVYNMLPKNKLRSGRMARLKVYHGADHPHRPQLAGSQTDLSVNKNSDQPSNHHQPNNQ